MGDVTVDVPSLNPRQATLEATRTIWGLEGAVNGHWGDGQACRRKAEEIHQYFIDALLDVLKNDPEGKGQVILDTYRGKVTSTYETLEMDPPEEF